MGKLFFDLEDINLNISDKFYGRMLQKFYTSNRIDEIYDAIMKYDMSQLSDSQKSIFVDMAKRMFYRGDERDRRDINSIIKHDTGFYTTEDICNHNYR